MRTNPFSDVVAFLFQPSWTTAVFWLLLVTSIGVAVYTLKRDQNQRALNHVSNWLARLVMGAMWWQQSLWKLPPTYTDQPDGSGGLHYWVGEMGKYAAFDFHRSFIQNVVQPQFYFFAPQVVRLRSVDRGFAHRRPVQSDWGALGRAHGSKPLARTIPCAVRVAVDLLLPHGHSNYVPGVPAWAQPWNRCPADAARIGESHRQLA